MQSGFDPDRVLRRLERNALIFCAVSTTAALVVSRGRWDLPLGVLGGGLLVALSYWAIRSSVTALVTVASGRPAGDDTPPRVARIWFGLVGRYALLGLMAYGMIARLRLSPVGLFIGISSLFAAACIEAARTVTARRTPRG